MPIISYFMKVPRYKDTTLEDIDKLQKYYSWENYKKSNPSCTLEEWCSLSEDNLPSKDVVDFYRQHYEKRFAHDELLGGGEYYTIYTELARTIGANQIFYWLVDNVIGKDHNEEWHEITREQLIELYHTCRKVKVNYIGKDEYGYDQYDVNEETANKFLPASPKGNNCIAEEYNSEYARSLVDTFIKIAEILERVNFDEYAVYYRANYQ